MQVLMVVACVGAAWLAGNGYTRLHQSQMRSLEWHWRDQVEPRTIHLN